MEGKIETACRICGYDDGTVLYDEYGCALFVICPCCYSEAGVTVGSNPTPTAQVNGP
ncbi:hypothetical protein [Streptomyces sp. NPDC001275]